MQAVVEFIDGLGELLGVLDQVFGGRCLTHVGGDVLTEVADALGHLVDEIIEVGGGDVLALDLAWARKAQGTQGDRDEGQAEDGMANFHRFFS
ncbi:MAG: hypothetical protein NVSMB9_18900 [Isosphaeraceae bacterium]